MQILQNPSDSAKRHTGWSVTATINAVDAVHRRRCHRRKISLQPGGVCENPYFKYVPVAYSDGFQLGISPQNYDGDARKIAMGGTGLSENIATSMIEDERAYRTIALPIGLIQVVQDIDRFKPKNKNIFDPVLVLEYAASPIHWTFGRGSSDAQRKLISGIINGNLSRNLNDYRVLSIPNNLRSEGLMSPSWGKTFKFHRSTEGAFQGFYVGAGPYFAAKTDLSIDKGLTDVLGSSTSVSIPNRNFLIGDRSVGQLAMAITGGYRARFTLPTMKSVARSDLSGNKL